MPKAKEGFLLYTSSKTMNEVQWHIENFFFGSLIPYILQFDNYLKND